MTMSDPTFDQTYAAILRKERDAAIERAESAEAETKDALADVAAQRYKGNSVGHWWAKAMAYGGIVFGCSPALAAAGHPVDASTDDGAVGGISRAVEALVAERDEAWERLAGLAGLLGVAVAHLKYPHIGSAALARLYADIDAALKDSNTEARGHCIDCGADTGAEKDGPDMFCGNPCPQSPIPPVWVGAQRWEEWRSIVKSGDKCQVGGALATVTRVTDQYLWATIDRYPGARAGPWSWEQCEPLDEPGADGGGS